jgi:hypothetical protein
MHEPLVEYNIKLFEKSGSNPPAPIASSGTHHIHCALHTVLCFSWRRLSQREYRRPCSTGIETPLLLFKGGDQGREGGTYVGLQ